VSTLWHASLLL